LGTTLDKNSQSPVYVAVIDDEIDLVHLFKDALSQIDGIEVFAFSDPNLALEHFQINHKHYKVVISDYRMPGMTGIELLSKIKNIEPTVIRILISAFEIQDGLFQECNCVDRFLQKPVSMIKMIDEVESIFNTMQIPNRKPTSST
jgi:DNA-binding NtrC family response regulator